MPRTSRKNKNKKKVIKNRVSPDLLPLAELTKTSRVRFNDALLNKMTELAERGMTNPEIAEAVGISPKTLAIWCNKSDKLLHAIKNAKDLADSLVEATLFHKAMGYSHRAVKIFYDKDRGECVEHEYVEQYPPDTLAMIFWLKNRQPKRWRDVKSDTPPLGDDEQESDNSNDAGVIIRFSDESDS